MFCTWGSSEETRAFPNFNYTGNFQRTGEALQTGAEDEQTDEEQEAWLSAQVALSQKDVVFN